MKRPPHNELDTGRGAAACGSLGLALIVIVSRMTPISSAVERNVGESLFLALAMRYERDIVPWRSADGP